MPCTASSSPASLRFASMFSSKPGRRAQVSRQPSRQSRPLSESAKPRFGVPVKAPPKTASP